MKSYCELGVLYEPFKYNFNALIALIHKHLDYSEPKDSKYIHLYLDFKGWEIFLYVLNGDLPILHLTLYAYSKILGKNKPYKSARYQIYVVAKHFKLNFSRRMSELEFKEVENKVKKLISL